MILFLTSGIALIAGLAAAFLARSYLSAPIPVIGNFARLQYAENPGIAFGLQLPSPLQEILIFGALLIVLVVAFKNRSRISAVGFGLILGGALANILDRLQDGLVTDYFAVGTFPVFNVPDSCITIGVCLLLVESIISMRGKQT